MSSQAQVTKNLPSREPSSEENKIIQDILAVSPASPSSLYHLHSVSLSACVPSERKGDMRWMQLTRV